MKAATENKQIIIKVGPPDKPYARIFTPDRRTELKDRREAHTFISNDRRSGLADRRKRQKE